MSRSKYKEISSIWNAALKRVHRKIILFESKSGSKQGFAAASFKKKIHKDPTTFLSEAWTHLEKSFFLDETSKEIIIQQYEANFKETRNATLQQAQQIKRHIFNVRGTGEIDYGPRIDWHQDPLSNYRWEPNLFYTRYHPSPYPGGPDITLPWELSRCQHFVTLGQAYWLTGDEQYVAEFADQVESWIIQNPWPLGVNWAGPMDLAIRVVNWLWAYALMYKSPTLSRSFHLEFYASLIQHGSHLRRNLERGIRLRTNHYLANLTGLLYLGLLLPPRYGVRSWADFSLDELNREIVSQFYADGTSFEASTSYHRLNTEMMVSCRLLARKNGLDFDPEAIDRLEKALEFIMQMTRPDGTVALIGDHDNGRLHRLKIWSQPLREWNDYRGLLGLGAILYSRRDFAKAAEDQWEEAMWLCKPGVTSRMFHAEDKKTSTKNTDELQGKAFINGGFFVIKKGNVHFTLRAGNNGQNGFGGHAHNDKLSFVLNWMNRDWLIDPGCYIYTRDYQSRNYFRSTAVHNTVQIDNEEQNPIPEKELFLLNDQAPVTLHTFDINPNFILFDASHSGYERLASPVTHRRKMVFPGEGEWSLFNDHFSGHGKHLVELFFNGGNSKIVLNEPLLSILEDPVDMHFRLGIFHSSSEPIERTVTSSWQSPGYGIKYPSNVLTCRIILNLPADITTLLFWGEALNYIEADVKVNGMGIITELISKAQYR